MPAYFSYFNQRPYDFGDSIIKDVTNISKYTAMFSRIADDVSFYSYYTMQPGRRLDEISEELYGTPEFYWTIFLVNSRITNVWRDLPKSVNAIKDFLGQKYPGVAFPIRDDQEIAGKFVLGEDLVYDTSNTAVLTGVYPTQGYLTAQITEGSSFPINSEMTLVGSSSSDTVVVNNRIPAYEAPHHHVDSNGNRVLFSAGQATPVSIRQVEFDDNDVESQIKVIRPEFIYDVSSRFENEMSQRGRQ